MIDAKTRETFDPKFIADLMAKEHSVAHAITLPISWHRFPHGHIGTPPTPIEKVLRSIQLEDIAHTQMTQPDEAQAAHIYAQHDDAVEKSLDLTLAAAGRTTLIDLASTAEQKPHDLYHLHAVDYVLHPTLDKRGIVAAMYGNDSDTHIIAQIPDIKQLAEIDLTVGTRLAQVNLPPVTSHAYTLTGLSVVRTCLQRV